MAKYLKRCLPAYNHSPQCLADYLLANGKNMDGFRIGVDIKQNNMHKNQDLLNLNIFDMEQLN
jgi:hypothetical protein